MTEDKQSVKEATDASVWSFGISSLTTFDYIILVSFAAFIVWYIVSRRRKEKDEDAEEAFTVLRASRLSTRPSISGGLVEKMQSGGRNIVVFYGSQTGTAEDFASRLSKEAARYGMKGMAADPEEVDMEELLQVSGIENNLAIFCMATYGEGDPTDNAQEFYNWLQNAEGIELNGMNYTVFGLGNKTYENFNAMGKYVDKRLEELGGVRVHPLGMGDDDGNIEENFLAWKEEMWITVCARFGISGDQVDVNMRQYRLEIPTEVAADKVYKGEVTRLGAFEKQRPPFDAKNPYLSAVMVRRDLCKDGTERRVLHMELDITESRIKYDCGDHVAVYPTNDEELVQKMAARLSADLDQVVSLLAIDDDNPKRHPFPCPTTYRTALSHYVDICSPPKTNVLSEIAEYAQKPEDAKFLKHLASIDGKTNYQEWILDSRRSILHVLEDLPSIKELPLDLLLEMLPRLQARYYSISSSPKMHPSAIHITAAIVQYTSKAGRHINGVTTNYLNNLTPGTRVPIYVRRSQFRLPYKSKTPIIMVGPGTGLAPFRGFIQDRKLAKSSGKPIGDTILYFGCRKQADDFLYESEIQEATKEKVLSALYLAFSRDQPEKVYVQHLMNREANRQQIWSLINEGGHFYICGDAKYMANDVNKTLLSIFEGEGKMTPVQAQEYLKTMQNKGRHSSDVWS